jgi:hypothetical protein
MEGIEVALFDQVVLPDKDNNLILAQVQPIHSSEWKPQVKVSRLSNPLTKLYREECLNIH